MRISSLSFQHLSDNTYCINTPYGQVIFCVKAYGLGSVVVDKHRTTLMSKATTNIDRFDRQIWCTVNGDDVPWWYEKEGPRETKCDGRMDEVLTRIAEHHENFIAKLIVE